MTDAAADPEIEEVLRIGRRAAEIIRAVYATAFTVELKGPADPVTRADREANEVICEALARAFPGDAILAEESVPDGAEVERRVRAPRVWFVDPLDGTREFVDRNGEFAVMIGLATAGRPALGVLVLPATGEALAGRVGEGGHAFLETPSGERTPLRVDGEADMARATIVVSRSHRPEMMEPFLRRLGVGHVTPCGSVGVKVARIVTGKAHLYVHGGGGAKLWDTCAPEAVLLAAGGSFTDLDGAPVTYATPELALPNGLVASNGSLQEPALTAIRELRAASSEGVSSKRQSLSGSSRGR